MNEMLECYSVAVLVYIYGYKPKEWYNHHHHHHHPGGHIIILIYSINMNELKQQ